MDKIVAATGHRTKDLSGDPKVGKARITEEVRALADDGYNVFVSGMAIGVDQIFAESVITLMDEGLDIKLVAAIPFIGQTSTWGDDAKERWRRILRRAYRIHVVQTSADYEVDEIIELEEEAKPQAHHVVVGALFGRNKWMVDLASKVLAVWNGSKTGGTANCVAYAKKQRRPIRWIKPPDFEASDILPEETT